MKVWLAKPTREEKAEVIASLLSGTTPAPTTTEEITSISLSGCVHVAPCCCRYVYVHYLLRLPNTTNSCRNVTMVHTTSGCTASHSRWSPCFSKRGPRNIRVFARRGSRCRAETPANVFLRGGMGSCLINM